MARRKRKKEAESTELPMTPMIDCVFQLLIYFVVTTVPRDVVANMDVFRPSPEERRQQVEMPKVIRIEVFPEGYAINDRPVTVEDLDRLLVRLAGIDAKQSVLIMSTADAPHGRLVTVLDLCAKNKLNNLSVLSTN
jgi:biopolymer transport protein ExbD